MPSGVYKRTEFHRKALRVPRKGAGIYHRTEEHKRNISETMKGNMPKFIPDNKGRKTSEETKRKQSEARKGYIVPMKIRNKLSKSLIGNKNSSGEKCNWWIDGRAKENNPYPEEWTDILRKSIRIRDNYICQMCGIHQDELNCRLKKLDVHHIDYNKDNLNPDNLTTLCRSCHVKTNYNREYWKQLFQNILQEKRECN